MPAPDKPRGIRRLIAAFAHSRSGFIAVWRSEEAFRLEAACLILGAPASLWLGETLFHAAALTGAVLLVMVAEVLNSAIEAAIDRIGPERHELSRRAKDLGSLSVLLAAFIAGLLWLAALATKFSA